MTRLEALEAEHAAMAAFLHAVSTEREVEAWEALEVAYEAVERGTPVQQSNTITRSRNGR